MLLKYRPGRRVIARPRTISSVRNTDRRIRTISRRSAIRQIHKNQEFKYSDNLQQLNVDSVGTLVDLTAIALGDTDTTRDGDKIMFQSLRARTEYAVADTTNVMRIMFIQWRLDSTITAPTTAQFLQDNTVPTISAYHHDNGYRFNILYDRKITLSTTGPAVKAFNIRLSKRRMRKIKQRISYSAGTTTGMYHIYLFIVSDSGTASHPSFQSYIRVSYTDS